MLDLSISTRLADETEPVTSKPTMGTLLQLERYFNLPSAIEALQQTKIEHVAWLAWESTPARRAHRADLGKVPRHACRHRVRQRQRHPFSRRGTAYGIASLALATGQPISELENASPTVIRALQAILKERQQAQKKAARRR